MHSSLQSRSPVWPTVLSTVPYPDNFRSWSHVKSGVIGPQHKNFASSGGLHHVYANPEAMSGYRTSKFPEQSVIVFEWLEWGGWTARCSKAHGARST